VTHKPENPCPPPPDDASPLPLHRKYVLKAAEQEVTEIQHLEFG